MQKNYSTSPNFNPNDSHIRQIVQQELQDFFLNIKTQIQMKIKQIDRSIVELKGNVDCLGEDRRENSGEFLKDMEERVSRIEMRVEELWDFKERQCERNQEFMGLLKNRSASKQKNLLFKTSPMLNLNTLVFGEENQGNTHNKIKDRIGDKPPLPNSTKKSKQKHEINKNKIDQQHRNYSHLEIQPSETHENPFIQPPTQTSQQPRQNRFVGQLNKNKNTFLRKKSQKKIYTIQQQSIQQSMVSNGSSNI